MISQTTASKYVSVEAKELASALKLANSIIEVRNTIPILNDVRLNYGKKGLSVEATDLDFAFQSRFSGQCVRRRTGKRAYYSVAQHCVIVAGHADRGHKLAALMHEVGEATCNDMSSPLKSQCPDYKRIEKRCEKAGLARFGIVVRDQAYIKHLDLRMLATEQRDLMPTSGETWGTVKGAAPFDPEIFPWENPHAAAETFLETYYALRRAGE